MPDIPAMKEGPCFVMDELTWDALKNLFEKLSVDYQHVLGARRYIR